MESPFTMLHGFPVVGSAYLKSDQAVKAGAQIHIPQPLLERLLANANDKAAMDELLNLRVFDFDGIWHGTRMELDRGLWTEEK